MKVAPLEPIQIGWTPDELAATVAAATPLGRMGNSSLSAGSPYGLLKRLNILDIPGTGVGFW